MNKKIVIATMNNHKVSEIKAFIGDSYSVMIQSDFSIPSARETGSSFEENALIKANLVAKKTNLLTLADELEKIDEYDKGYRENKEVVNPAFLIKVLLVN